MSYTTIKDKLIGILKGITDFKDSYSASTISFVAATKTISDSASGLVFVVAGDVVTITGSVSNNGVFRVATGAVAGSFTVEEALVNENAGATITLALPTHVTHGDYSVMDRGVGNCLILVPGPVSEALKQAGSAIRTWTLYADLFAKFTDESASWLSFIALRSAVIDQLEKYPMLNNSSNILKISVSAGDDPSGVFDKDGTGGPFWLNQRFTIQVTERTALSGGDFA